MAKRNAKQALIAWAKQNEITPEHFALMVGYGYQHAWNLLRGTAPVTFVTLGRLLWAYGPEVAEPIAEAMRMNGFGGQKQKAREG